jgi:putative tricarboxylic transport membrane protein
VGAVIVQKAVQLLLMAVAVAGLFGSNNLGWGSGDAPGPGLFPGIASVMLLVLAGAGFATRPPSLRAPTEPIALRRLGWYVAGVVLAGTLFAVLGYPMAAALALIVILIGGERLTWWRACIVAVLAVGATTALFMFLLDVPLPIAPDFRVLPVINAG